MNNDAITRARNHADTALDRDVVEVIHEALDMLRTARWDAAKRAGEAANAETVRVRIAVAVNEHGEWSAAGWGARGGIANYDKAASDVASDGLSWQSSDCERTFWVEADVPKPAPPVTVEGEALT